MKTFKKTLVLAILCLALTFMPLLMVNAGTVSEPDPGPTDPKENSAVGSIMGLYYENYVDYGTGNGLVAKQTIANSQVAISFDVELESFNQIDPYTHLVVIRISTQFIDRNPFGEWYYNPYPYKEYYNQVPRSLNVYVQETSSQASTQWRTGSHNVGVWNYMALNDDFVDEAFFDFVIDSATMLLVTAFPETGPIVRWANYILPRLNTVVSNSGKSGDKTFWDFNPGLAKSSDEYEATSVNRVYLWIEHDGTPDDIVFRIGCSGSYYNPGSDYGGIGNLFTNGQEITVNIWNK